MSNMLCGLQTPKTVTMAQCNYREQYGKQPMWEQISRVVKEILADRKSATTAERWMPSLDDKCMDEELEAFQCSTLWCAVMTIISSTANNPIWCPSWMVSSAVAAGTATKWTVTLQYSICCQPDWPHRRKQKIPCSPLWQLEMWVIAARWMHIAVSCKTNLMALCFWQAHCEWGCVSWHAGVVSVSTALGTVTSHSAHHADLPLLWHTFVGQLIGWEEP